jgi:hypothetical protein
MPDSKRGLLCVCSVALCGAPCTVYATGLGNGFGNANALTLYARVSINWVWDSLGVCPIPLSPQKKYVFSCIVTLPVALQLLVFPFPLRRSRVMGLGLLL